MNAQEVLDRFHAYNAWRAYFPTPTNPWDEAKIAHLYRRATGGVTGEQMQAGLKDLPEVLVARLVGGPGRAAEVQFERDMAVLTDRLDAVESFQAAWLHRLLYSPHPLRERMTLFWHDHFATSNAKVQNVRLMQIQNETFRRHALGRFDALLQEMTFDPAMILWLDGQTNRVGAPNENYAREVMELFSLGVGHYTETDIREAARALTGWEVKGDSARFNPDLHDTGEKTVLGQRGNWTAGDVIRICLSQPACAMFLVRKLFRFFVSETAEPNDELLTPLAEGFRARNYDIAWVVGQLLSSWVFFSPAAIGQIVKSPIDYLVGLVRSLDGRPNLIQLAKLTEQLGQNLFYPPSVKGWDGGPAWLNSTSLLRRQNAAFDATLGHSPLYRSDPVRIALKHNLRDDEALARFFLQLFHQRVDPETVQNLVTTVRNERQSSAGAPEELARTARSIAHLAALLPEFQLC